MDDYISKPVRIAELQSALEHWGPLRSRKSDTAFFTRGKATEGEVLLDQAVIADLRAMPPTDGKQMLQELVELFLREAPPHLAKLTTAVDDPPRLAFHAHALKSMSLNLGARRLIELCQKLETMGQAGSCDAAPALLQELNTVFTQTKAQLVPLRNP